MEIILIANEKGGTGKTTTALALATCLKAYGYRTLAVDMDPSGHLTAAALPDDPPRNRLLYNVFTGQCPVKEAIIHAPACDILPTMRDTGEPGRAGYDPKRGIIPLPRVKQDLDALFSQFQMSGSEYAEYALNAILRHPDSDLASNYDYIVIDPPPTANLIVTNCIVAADSVIIPCAPYAASVDGMKMLLSSIVYAKQRCDTDVKIDGLVMAQYSEKWGTRREMVAEIERMVKENNLSFYKTRFRNSGVVERSLNECRSLLDFVSSGTGAADALNFTLEFLRKRGLRPKADFPGVHENENGDLVFTYQPKNQKIQKTEEE